MVNSHEYYMKFALREAEAARDRNEIPVGAVVVCNGRIIARAHNLTETLTDVTAHAEMQVITAAANVLGGKSHRMYIVCHSRTLCNVCWCLRLVSGRGSCIWGVR